MLGVVVVGGLTKIGYGVNSDELLVVCSQRCLAIVDRDATAIESRLEDEAVEAFNH